MAIMDQSVAIILPCYKTRNLVSDVLRRVEPYVDYIICVDDKCPEETGKFVSEQFLSKDQRLHVLFLDENEGVGGATLAGMDYAVGLGADILVKVDSDGQMDPRLVDDLVSPIASGEADYSKGNRFYDPKFVRGMPLARIIGNAGLSFLTKASSGYWNIFDPTNGFLAIHSKVYELLESEKIERRYFFESDLLFHIGLLRAKVNELPMWSVYGDEQSNLNVVKELFKFAYKNIKNAFKRILFNYFLRNFSIASILLVVGVFLSLLGGISGIALLIQNQANPMGTSAGQVMLSAFPLFIGVQMLITFVALDISAVPSKCLWTLAGTRKARKIDSTITVRERDILSKDQMGR